jgi:hypothetical protein
MPYSPRERLADADTSVEQEAQHLARTRRRGCWRRQRSLIHPPAALGIGNLELLLRSSCAALKTPPEYKGECSGNIGRGFPRVEMRVSRSIPCLTVPSSRDKSTILPDFLGLKKGAAGVGGRRPRANPVWDGEGWGRDRGRVSPEINEREFVGSDFRLAILRWRSAAADRQAQPTGSDCPVIGV